MEELRKFLKDTGIQVTRQRLEVFQILKELNTHTTAEDIRKVLDSRGISMTVATIYNILNLFEEKGLIMRVGTAGEPVIFDINAFGHAHIFDSESRHVLELVTDYLKAHPVKDLELQRVEINLVGHDKEGTA